MLSAGGVALTEWEMSTVGSELALGCDGWIIGCLNGRLPYETLGWIDEEDSGCYGTWLLAFVSAAAN
jgi:hypothetical protein